MLFLQASIRNGIMRGRRGYGSIYVVASGNGGNKKDNCNFDGYANSIYFVTIGKIMCGVQLTELKNEHRLKSYEICIRMLSIVCTYYLISS